jgi:co-chaperonin GroES (HSP10)
VRENHDSTREINGLLVIRTEPEKLLSGRVLGVGDHPVNHGIDPDLLQVGATVWFRRECGYEVPNHPGYLFLQTDMLEAVGEAQVVALAVGDRR